MARMKSNLPDEMVHTDDCDFMTEVEQMKDMICQKANEGYDMSASKGHTKKQKSTSG